MEGYHKRYYPTETAIRDAQRHFRERSRRGPQEERVLGLRYVLWVQVTTPGKSQK